MLSSFRWDLLGVGVKNLWMNVTLCGDGVGRVDRLYPAFRFVSQRLKLTVFSCILNPDWLLLMRTTLCHTQIPQGVPCVS